jgi:hypothetical protein
MSTYDSGAGYGTGFGTGGEGEIPRMSGLAIAALVCALIFCIPILPPIGVILGLIALVTMVGKSHLRGRGMAIAAIVLGLAFSIGWGIFAWFSINIGSKVVTLMRDTPSQAMQAGLAGDVKLFQSNFHGAGATLPEADAQAFLDEVKSRFGTLNALEFDEKTPVRPQPGQPTVDAPYTAKFSSGDVKANVELVIMDAKTGTFIYKIGSIEFVDPQRGNLRFPPLPKPPGSLPAPPKVDTPADAAAPAAGAGKGAAGGAGGGGA